LRELNESHWGAYIGSKSNRAVGEKAVKKVLMPVNPMLPLAIVGLPDECIFSASELAVGNQSMIFLKYIGLTDEHCWLESKKECSLLEWTDAFSFVTGLTDEHILSHSVSRNAPL
jgi:hypothetical protein